MCNLEEAVFNKLKPNYEFFGNTNYVSIGFSFCSLKCPQHLEQGLGREQQILFWRN